jgi:CDP-diacylglycerol--glycerol-3-phosphate 3-phosphatidyltransferase
LAVFDAPDNEIGRYLAGGQMAFLTLALAPAVPGALATAVAPAVLAPSLAVFLRDYLVVAGWFQNPDATPLPSPGVE